MNYEHDTVRFFPLAYQKSSPGATVGFAHTIRTPRALVALGTVKSYGRGEPIYAQGSPARQWYRVISGLARKCLSTASGRRRIVDFLTAGDYFGLTAADQHVFGIEAVIPDTLIACYATRHLERMAADDPEISAIIRDAAFATISRLQARILILGQTTAQEKVGSFLLAMAGRHMDQTADIIILPMSRYDIADYLAISVETISRVLTQFKRSGTIKIAGARQIEIIDRAGLAGRDDEV